MQHQPVPKAKGVECFVRVPVVRRAPRTVENDPIQQKLLCGMASDVHRDSREAVLSRDSTWPFRRPQASDLFMICKRLIRAGPESRQVDASKRAMPVLVSNRKNFDLLNVEANGPRGDDVTGLVVGDLTAR